MGCSVLSGVFNNASNENMPYVFKLFPISPYVNDEACALWSQLNCFEVDLWPCCWNYYGSRGGRSLRAVNCDRWREMEYSIWWQDKTAKRRGEIKGWWENKGGGDGCRDDCSGEGARRSEFVCDALKFWSGKSLHLLLWDGSDSVISMIGLNPSRVEKTEWRA